MLQDQCIEGISRQAGSIYAIAIVEARLVGRGSGNWNYFLETDGDAFVLSVIEEQSAEEVEVMARTLNWLELYEYPTTTLQKTAEKALTAVIDEKPALLRRFIRGNVCWAPDEEQVRQVGASIASLHAVPCPSFLPQDIYYTQDRFRQALESGHDRQYEEWVVRSLDRIDIGSYASLPKGLIHADVFPDNVLFNGGDLTAIIDFELACNYVLAFDVAMAIVGMCVTDGIPCSRRIDSLVAGYESVRVLSNEEKASIKPLAEYAAIMTSLWRYWRYRCHEPGHFKQHAYQEMAAVAQRFASIELNPTPDALALLRR
ncbi:MAG: homoserine kinase [Beijerinckiaceae bacterium]|nr:homoserine kinase [Beijerinckiaceae bacterium]